MNRTLRVRLAALFLGTWSLASAPVALAQAGTEAKAASSPRLTVTELARTVDLSRGKEEFLTITVEVSGTDPLRLRRVQPARADFRVTAGKRSLPCRWLRGGSVPEDPSRLRFTLGFSLPPATVKQVSLVAELPGLDGDDLLELRLPGLKLGEGEGERSGPGWSIVLQRFAEENYVPPVLPKQGRYVSKLGPIDVRVFRKAAPTAAEPQQAVVLAFRTLSTSLYDATLDVSGELTLEGGGTLPLLSASLRREPSITVEKPLRPPVVRAEFYFPLAGKRRVNGAVLRLHRRQPKAARQTVRIANLPVPGR